MADWSDLKNKTIEEAEVRADTFGYDVAVFKIGDTYVSDITYSLTRPTIMLEVDEHKTMVVGTAGVHTPSFPRMS